MPFNNTHLFAQLYGFKKFFLRHWIYNYTQSILNGNNQQLYGAKCFHQIQMIFKQMHWLVVWVLWHINLCRLFNAKSIFIQIVKLATIVKGDQKAPFSIATIPRCRGGHYSFPWIAPLYPWYVPYVAEC